MNVRALHPAAWSLAILLLCGCAGSPPVYFYTLSAEVPAGSEPVSAKPPLRIAVGPVSLPEVVDRPQFVVRAGPNQVQVVDEHRWAESLKTDVPRVIAENLGRLLGTGEVWSYPETVTGPVDYRVQIAIQRFDSVPGQSVTVGASWVIQRDGADRADGKTGRSSVQQPVAGSGYEALAAAHSRALAAVCREIAEAIRLFSAAKP